MEPVVNYAAASCLLRAGPAGVNSGMRITPGLLSLLVFVAHTHDSAHAQTVTSPYRFIERKHDITAFASHVGTDRGSADLGPESGFLYGLRYTLRISSPLRVSGLVSYFPTRREVVDPTPEEGADKLGKQDLDLLLVAGQAQLYLTGSRSWHNLVPHLFGGLGLAFDLTGTTACVPESTLPDCSLAPSERYDFGNRFMLQVGLGLAWLPSDRIGLRLSVQDNLWRIGAPVGFLAPAVEPIAPETEWTNNLEASLGLSLWF